MTSFFSKLGAVRMRDLPHLFLFALALPIAWVYRRRRKDLWLLCDHGVEAADNAVCLFEWIRKNCPTQDCVYAVHRSCPDYPVVAALGPTVEYGSFKHWILYLTARVNISSQKGGKPNAAVCYLLEVYGFLRNTRVFLQHGVIFNDIPFLHYANTRMSMFVCSARQEYDFIAARYGYPTGVLKLLGLARWDRLHRSSATEKNLIVIMPTWRMSLGTIALCRDRAADRDRFLPSDYFKRWNGLLNSEELRALCARRDCRVVFYPHREIQRFIDCFRTANPAVSICGYPAFRPHELIQKAAFLITDYSSVHVDFAYLRKPLAYYQFDYDSFYATHYREGYFDFRRDGFGPVCSDEASLLHAVDAAAANGFVNEPKYLERHAAFFTLWDADNCRRNYEAIRDLAKEGER